MEPVMDPGRSGRSDEAGSGVLGDFGTGRLCFVAKVTPEGVGRDLARKAAGKLSKTGSRGQVRCSDRAVRAALRIIWSFTHLFAFLDESVDGIRTHLIAFSEGGDGRTAREPP